ncbi:MAG: hypothetical protein ACI906_004667 [Candidatus Latescibacterota bacterium]|jgi:hypothetical protein
MVQSPAEGVNTTMSLFSRLSPRGALGLLLVLVSGLAVLAQESLREGMLRLETSVENFRDAPNGRKLGTLAEGTQIEKIAQEGQWVRFRIEGWVWGPSLEGFVEEKPPESTAGAEPRRPLQDAVPRAKRLINESFGTFYGLNIDADLNVLRVRLRVGDIGAEKLERRQLSVQKQVWDLVRDEIDVVAVRVETNRADGSGAVGTVIAECKVEALKSLKVDDVEQWRKATRFSKDGGKTWESGE